MFDAGAFAGIIVSIVLLVLMVIVLVIIVICTCRWLRWSDQFNCNSSAYAVYPYFSIYPSNYLLTFSHISKIHLL